MIATCREDLFPPPFAVQDVIYNAQWDRTSDGEYYTVIRGITLVVAGDLLTINLGTPCLYLIDGSKVADSAAARRKEELLALREVQDRLVLEFLIESPDDTTSYQDGLGDISFDGPAMSRAQQDGDIDPFTGRSWGWTP